MSLETFIPTPSPEELDALVYGEQAMRNAEVSSHLATSAFEALATMPENAVENPDLVNRGTKYTMPEGDTDE